MFLWLEFVGLDDSFQLVMERLFKRRVLVVAGGAFNLLENKPCSYARVAYSRASAEEMEKVQSFCLSNKIKSPTI